MVHREMAEGSGGPEAALIGTHGEMLAAPPRLLARGLLLGLMAMVPAAPFCRAPPQPLQFCLSSPYSSHPALACPFLVPHSTGLYGFLLSMNTQPLEYGT